MASGNGFADWSPADLKDPTLWKVNQDMDFLFARNAALWGTGNPVLQSAPAFATAYASSQSVTNLKPNEFLTKAIADELYIGGAGTGGTTAATIVITPAMINTIKNQLGGGTANYGTHALRPGPAVPVTGSLYYETDRTVLYQTLLHFSTPIWQYVAGGMVGTLAGLPTDLGTADTGFLYYATDYYHLYQWNGAAWAFAAGTESSGIISAAIPGHLYPAAAWKPCDGSAITISTAAGTLDTVTTPPMNTGVFLRGIAAGSYTGATVAPTATTLLTNVTVTTSVAPASTGITGTGNNSGNKIVASGSGATVASDPHTHTISDPTHYHTATDTVTQPTFKPPSDANGGLPSNLSVVWYMRI
jgi:hypothetical protein